MTQIEVEKPPAITFLLNASNVSYQVDEFNPHYVKEVYSGEPMKKKEGDTMIFNETTLPFFDLRLSLTPTTEFLVLTSEPLSYFDRLLLWVRSNFIILAAFAILYKYLSKESL